MSLYAGTPPLTGSFVASRSSLTLDVFEQQQAEDGQSYGHDEGE